MPEGGGSRSAVQAGVTLAELLAVMAILGILAGVAVPGMAQLLADRRVDAATARFHAHISRARSEAIFRGRRVVACPTADGSHCLSDGIWHDGWMLFVDLDADREHHSGEPVLARSGSLGGVRMETSRMRRRIVYYPNGLARGSNGTYTFCGDGRKARPLAVIISNTGRARRSRVRPDGSPLECDVP